MHIIFARHGETDYNKKHAFQGLLDAPLNKLGFSQARNLAYYCKSIHLRKIFSSPLKRAQQTAKIVAKVCNLPIYTDKRLREICYGDWEGMLKKNIDPYLLEMREKDRFNFVHPGKYYSISGESYAQQYKRALPFIISSLKTEHNKSLLIVSHGGILACVTRYYGSPLSNKNSLTRFKNNEVLEITSKSKIVVRTINNFIQ